MDVAMHRLRHSPHVLAEHLDAIHLPSLLSPRRSEVEPTVRRDAQFDDAHDANLVPCLLQGLDNPHGRQG